MKGWVTVYQAYSLPPPPQTTYLDQLEGLNLPVVLENRTNSLDSLRLRPPQILVSAKMQLQQLLHHQIQTTWLTQLLEMGIPRRCRGFQGNPLPNCLVSKNQGKMEVTNWNFRIFIRSFLLRRIVKNCAKAVCVFEDMKTCSMFLDIDMGR